MKYFVLNRFFLLFLLSIIFLGGFSQSDFETGFYTDNKGENISGFIKNNDWLNEPNQIQFKESDKGEIIKLSIEDVQYFEVGIYRFRRAEVQVDQSYTETSLPGGNAKPDYISDSVFLRLLVDGDARLYRLGSQNRFYYSVGNDSIQHLLFKRYMVDNQIRNINTYKTQLFESLKCDDMTIQDMQNLKFGTKDLMKYFKKYNECKDDLTYVYEKKKKVLFHLSPTIGMRMARVNQTNTYNTSWNVDFPQEMSVSFSLNMEYVLPFNNDKWSIYFEPLYQSYKSEIDLQNNRGSADYKSIELHLGLKYYMYLSQTSILFLNASLMNTEIVLDSHIGPNDVKSTYNFTVGGGYMFKEKLSLAARIGTAKELLREDAYTSAKYHYYELVLAYRIL